MHSLAIPPYLKWFLCSGLLRFAPYCAPGGVRVVSLEAQGCFTIMLTHSTRSRYVQLLVGHASTQLTLDRYSHWMPSMGRNTAEGTDEALG
jgi:hypothetical protein